MKSLPEYIEAYAVSHRNPRNIWIHTLCVPAIAWSLIGFLHTFPLMSLDAFEVRLSHGALLLILLYYAFFKNGRLLVTMLLVALFFLFSFAFVPYLREVCIGVFVLAWAGQFYGHKIEGKKPSFFEDLFFLLIGPVWVIHKLAPGWLKIS